MSKILTIIFVLFISVVSYGYDIEGGLQSGMAGNVLFTVPSASGFLICPSNGLSSGKYAVETGWSRKYELSDLDKVSFMAAYRHNNISGAIGVSQLGTAGYYTDMIIRAAFSYHYDKLTTSLLTSGEIMEFGDNLGKYKAAAVGLGLSYSYNNYFFGLTVDNLNKPKIVENGDGENILAKLFVEVDGGERHSIAGRVVWEKYEKPMASISQYFNISKNNALFWGLSHNPLTYGGGVVIGLQKFSLCYAVSYHPTLGFSHNVSLSFLSFGGNNLENQ